MKFFNTSLIALGLSLLAVSAANASAPDPVPAGTFPVTFDLSAIPDCSEMKVAINAAEASNRSLVMLRPTAEGSCILKGDMYVGKTGIYNLYCYNLKRQYRLPVSIGPSTGTIKLSIDGNVLSTDLSDPANHALGAYDDIVTGLTIRIGNEAASMSPDQLKAVISRIPAVTDSIVDNTPSLPAEIKQYLYQWGYSATSDAISLALHLRKNVGLDIPFATSDMLPPPVIVFNNPMSACFPSSTSIIASSLNGKTLEEKMADLYASYDDEGVRSRVSSALLDSFLNNFDYKNSFDDGVARLTALTERYSLPASWVDNFKSRKVTIPGTPFPEGITLVDRNGNPVDFSSFKGKYVFVDLWASWCGPCVGEVPHMQKLEKEFEGSDDVTFVSISVDNSEDAWLKKMDQLNMHGNQLRDASGQLCNRLNVKGIPHFLLYDRDGNLLVYKTTRPSHKDTLPMLKSLK